MRALFNQITHMKIKTSFSHCNLSFVLLLATVSFPSSVLSSSTTALIDRTCKLTPFYDLCISTLLNDPQSPSADIHGLGAIIVTYFLRNVIATLCNIQGMISRSPPVSEKSLAYCAKLYIPIIKYSLLQSIEVLEKERYGFAVYGIADVEKGIEECEKRVEGGGEDLIAVKAWNEVVRELADVALAIIKVL